MINNYYSIPSIPCKERLIITPNDGEREEKCQGLNPNNVYQTLYPSKVDPLINYFSQENMAVNGDPFKSMFSDTKNCAIDCSNNPDCRHLEIDKQPNFCYLYSSTDTERKDVNKDEVNLNVYRKNDLLDGTNLCNIEDAFISQPSGYYPVNGDNPTKIIRQEGLSKKECLSTCAFDDNCHSVVYGEPKSTCKQFSGEIRVKPKKFTKTYSKKPTPVGNRFDAPDNLQNYYQTYNTEGRENDYFCEYVENTGKCETSYIVGRGGNKIIPKESKPDPLYVPSPKICLPPHCNPQKPDDGLISKLTIDNNINIRCAPGDDECNNKINGIINYSMDFMGLPTPHGEPNPSNPYLPYTQDFNEYKNLQINTPEMEIKPALNALEFKEECEKWCKNSVDCGGFSHTIGNDGRAECKYYRTDDIKNMKNTITPKEYTNSKIKKSSPIVRSPNKNLLNKSYFNNMESGAPSQTVKICKPGTVNPDAIDKTIGSIRGGVGNLRDNVSRIGRNTRSSIGSTAEESNYRIIDAEEPRVTGTVGSNVNSRIGRAVNLLEGFQSENWETRPNPPCPNGWWQNGNVCLQVCPLNSQTRNNDGTCICNRGGDNQNCAPSFQCVNNSCKRLEAKEAKETKETKWTVVYSKGNFGNVNLGEQITNRLFAETKIFKRECADCDNAYKVIYYKRISPIPNNFSIYNQFNNWTSINNVLNKDFKLYYSYTDLINDTDGWTFCNYDDPQIGFPRDCGGRRGVLGFQWNSLTRGGQQNVKYSILDPEEEVVNIPPLPELNLPPLTGDELYLKPMENRFGKCPNTGIDKYFSWGNNCQQILEYFANDSSNPCQGTVSTVSNGLIGKLLNCKNSTFGCCSDGVTMKMDTTGVNCDNTSRDNCLNSKNGCCPGTTTPKEYICDCSDSNDGYKKYTNRIISDDSSTVLRGDFFKGDAITTLEDAKKILNETPGATGIIEWKANNEAIYIIFKKKDGTPINERELIDATKNIFNITYSTIVKNNNRPRAEDDFNCNTDFCKDGKNRYLTNCELNARQTGDPYEFNSERGVSCKDNSNCGKQELCIDGYCKKINMNYYNGLNNVQQGFINTNSGNSLDNMICGPRNTKDMSENKSCAENYEPVCGTNSKTYKNDCHANRSGVDVQYYGACDNMIENFVSSQVLLHKPRGHSSNLSIFLFLGVLIIFLFIIFNKINLKKYF